MKTHGHKSNGVRTRTYVCWVNMKGRCSNPNRPDAKNYFGRGISFDPAWESFENFLADMGEVPEGKTLDRLDNNLGYSKSNCAWRTRTEQNLNKRSCVRYTLNGQAKTLGEWSKETGIGRVTMLKRIQSGIPVEIALTHKGFLGYFRSQRA